MKITIFGATGRIARLAAEQALASGDQITAVVRDPARLDLSPHPALEVVTVAGLTDPAPLIAALRGSDAALSGVGPRGRRTSPSPRPRRGASSLRCRRQACRGSLRSARCLSGRYRKGKAR